MEVLKIEIYIKIKEYENRLGYIYRINYKKKDNKEKK